MKLFQQTKGVDDPERGLHILERHGWTKGGYKRLMTIEVVTFCGKTLLLEKGEGLTEYVKEKHRRQVCERCVNAIKLRPKNP